MSELPGRGFRRSLDLPERQARALDVAATEPRRGAPPRAPASGLTDTGQSTALGSGDVEAVAARVVELLDLPLHRLLMANEVARLARLLAVDVALRRPDLVLVPPSGPGSSVAVEVEATVNGARRLQAICAGCARRRRVAVVRCYATRAGAARAAHAHGVIEAPSLTQTLEACGVSFAA